MNINTPVQSLGKAWSKRPIDADELQKFKSAFDELFDLIEAGQAESTQRKFFTSFMEQVLHGECQMTHEENRIDLAIHTDKRLSSPVGVLVELKKLDNKDEMVTKDDINRKALQELLFYYLNERVSKENLSLKYLMATNTYELFVWDAQLFEKKFHRNKPLLKDYDDFINKRLDFTDTDGFYKKIAAKYIDEVKDELDFTYANLQSIHEQSAKGHQKALVPLYKLLSATHLMKLPVANDSNELNTSFYRELLHIMGIEEWVDKDTHKIRRVSKGAQKFSLMEQTWARLDDYGFTDKEREKQFECAMGLLITWINRILFLKLLESQLVSFGNGSEAKFLDVKTIPDYDLLHDLFLKVLAKPEDERDEELRKRFPLVPYLNSSLFEMSPLEHDYFTIGALRLGEMDVYKQTVLRDGNGKKVAGKLATLEYLLRFLDAYDFGANKVEDGVRTGGKTLINASVLGLIFEKINGYKDGSFFTPGYITEYICHETLRKAVVDKFNAAKPDWHCQDFDDLQDHIVQNREGRTEANAIINSLKICDPAVGSGHFLVSALNELIAIKSELGVLQDRQEKPKPITRYQATVVNDELTMIDDDGDLFRYSPSDGSSQIIQQALFEEKREIIENCLYGVDLNPKSVEICRLRLWIELLKNAYYYKNEQGKRTLQTLPNIDINIKQGNSLASNQPVCIGRRITVGEGMRKLVADYKANVRAYKGCRSKALKMQLNKDISDLKRKLMPPVQLEAFSDNKHVVSRNKTMQQALEWMIEFPEVLDEEGVFTGFDVVVGNPPYISLERLKDDSLTYSQMRRRNEYNIHEKTYLTHESRGDIYALFVERGVQLLRKGGWLSFILPNKWEKVMYGRPLRKLFLQNDLVQLVDFRDLQIFDDATTYTCIIQMKKARSAGALSVSTMKEVKKESFPADVEAIRETFDKKEMDFGIWVTTSLDKFKLMRRIKAQGSGTCTLGTFVGGECYYGIKTGLTEMFLVSRDTRDELMKDESSRVILRPFLQGRDLKGLDLRSFSSYLLFIPKGFTLQGMGIVIDEEGLKREKKKKSEVMPSEEDAWQWFQSHYPAVAGWLFGFKDKAQKRSDKGDYWWELRACDYYDKFAAPKILYQRFQITPCFVYDDSSTFFNDSMYFLSVNNKSLLAVLSSKMGWWLISELCPRIQNGHQLIWDNFRQIPIPQSLPDSLADLATQAEQATANEDMDALLRIRNNIDREVFRLYRLTYDDVLVIDPATPITRDEYENR